MSKQVKVKTWGVKVIRKIDTQVKYRYLNNQKKVSVLHNFGKYSFSIKKKAAFTFCGGGKLHVTGCNGPLKALQQV